MRPGSVAAYSRRMGPTVSVVETITDEVYQGLRRLLPQLAPDAPALARATLDRLVASPATTLLVARLDGPIVGTLTLVTVPALVGYRCRVEDVVVDAAVRGAGVGAALTVAALDLARAAGAESVELTSRPERDAANRLYRRLGFERRDTNAYRYPLR